LTSSEFVSRSIQGPWTSRPHLGSPCQQYRHDARHGLTLRTPVDKSHAFDNGKSRPRDGSETRGEAGLTGAEKLAFLDAAALQRREIPPDVAGNVILEKSLPAFFRAAGGHELKESELRGLAKDIKKLHKRDDA